jgi:glycerol transport system ATP-binding protein
MTGQTSGESIMLKGNVTIALPRQPNMNGVAATIGVRAHDLRVTARDGDVSLPARVELAEISGSDTFLHAETAVGDLVAQLTGVHRFNLGEAVTLHVNPEDMYVFDGGGMLTMAPSRVWHAIGGKN